jgi:4-amino-4-deoxy-L-arabinose transferase-like glycosyltransferase
MATKKKSVSASSSHARAMKNGNMLFVAAMFIGMGVGYLVNQFVVFMFIGMGVGFFLKYWVDRQM